MGVRGLTTFIKSQENKFLKTHRLHGCQILLDGNSVATNLFIWSNVESAFGGDYDKFAKYVKEFFKVLKKCGISPLVVFDGGYERRKLKTVYTRMKDKLKSTKSAHPISGPLNFPLFMRIVFREVLSELGIPFAQSDFEADDELAALARKLNCPILSYDSDFFIYDVLYIPLPSLNLEPCELITDCDSERVEYYLECKIYSVDNLLNSFGGLDRSMLPLLATVLGNDYIKRSVFKAFYANLKIPKGKSHPLKRRIKAVVEWLRNETFESAVKKILGRIKKNARKRVSRQLKQTVNGYIKCTSILSEHLGISSNPNVLRGYEQTSVYLNSNIVDIIENIDSNLDLIQPTDLDEINGSSSDTSSQCSNVDDYGSDGAGSCEEDCEMRIVIDQPDINCTQQSIHEDIMPNELELNSRQIPSWLLELSRRGKIQSCVIDMLSLGQYFSHSQVEDTFLPPSHSISFHIVSAIVGLLKGESVRFVRVWSRKGSRCHCYRVEPLTRTNTWLFPPCDKIPQLSESERKSILLEVAENTTDLSLIPEDWTLFFVSAVYWLRKMEQPVSSEIHLHTIIMCLVGMVAIDSKIGMHRNQQTFNRKYKNCLAKIEESKIKDKEKTKENKSNEHATTSNARATASNEHATPENPIEGIDNVSFEDCVFVFKTLLSFHHLSEEIKVKPKTFCLTTVHAFSQLQSSMYHFKVLNSILGFPFKELSTYQFFSGTYYYNVFTNLSKRSNINAYIETFFKKTPTLLVLYKALVNVLEQSLNGVTLEKKPIKAQKKRKKTVLTKTCEVPSSDIVNEEDEEFFDDNNIYSRLLNI